MVVVWELETLLTLYTLKMPAATDTAAALAVSRPFMLVAGRAAELVVWDLLAVRARLGAV